MPDSQPFSLAKRLEYLLDGEMRPPWITALLALPLLGLFFWLVSQRQTPTRAESAAQNRRQHCRSIVQQKYIDNRGNPVLFVENNQTAQADWLDYVPAALAADTTTRLTIKQLRQYSLAAYARPGDSLIKKIGELSATVKHGKRERHFYFRCLWP